MILERSSKMNKVKCPYCGVVNVLDDNGNDKFCGHIVAVGLFDERYVFCFYSDGLNKYAMNVMNN
jgi:hypothetical protein